MNKEKISILAYDIYNFIKDVDYYNTIDNVSDDKEGINEVENYLINGNIEGILNSLEEYKEDCITENNIECERYIKELIIRIKNI